MITYVSKKNLKKSKIKNFKNIKNVLLQNKKHKCFFTTMVGSSVPLLTLYTKQRSRETVNPAR